MLDNWVLLRARRPPHAGTTGVAYGVHASSRLGDPVRYAGGYRVWLRFNDGLDGEIDLSSELHGEVFEPLRAIALFSQLRLHPEYDTIVWPNGADLAPEFLYEQVKRAVSDAA